MSITIYDIATHMEKLPCLYDFHNCLSEFPQFMEMGFEDAMNGRPLNYEFSEVWQEQMSYELGRLVWYEIRPYKDLLILRILAEKKQQYGNQ